jgi:phosphomannomutase
MRNIIFKAYDIRGKYPEEINEKIVSEIITALIKNLKPKTIVIGHDARLSSPSLYKTLIKKLGVISIGLSTTPMFYFLVNYFNADLGIMITASHNPKEYNGLKIVGKKAIPISGKEILHLINGRGHDEIKIKNKNE